MTTHAMQQPAGASAQERFYSTDLPPRLDRVPWTRFHTLLVMALATMNSAVAAERRPLEHVARPLSQVSDT